MGFDSGGFEEMLRAIARELSESVERSVGELDLDEMAGKLGVDAERAREFVRGAGEWLRAQSAAMNEEPSRQPPPSADRPAPEPPRSTRAASDAAGFAGAAPHPLDLPTEEQGVALAALESGRWSVEPGTNALTVHGNGPGPSDALGLVRELRVRDWISAEGTLTLTGRRALARWLESAGH